MEKVRKSRYLKYRERKFCFWTLLIFAVFTVIFLAASALLISWFAIGPYVKLLFWGASFVFSALITGHISRGRWMEKMTG